MQPISAETGRGVVLDPLPAVVRLKVPTTTLAATILVLAAGSTLAAEWVVEAPSSSGGVLPLANFGTATISGASATLNGHTGAINDGAWQNDKIDMVNSSGAVKAATSGLGSGGSSFSVTWQSSN